MTSLFYDLDLKDFAALVCANPNLVHELNEEGETPLFVQTSLPYIRILAKAGANLVHQNIHGDTVLHQSGNSPDCVLYLLKKADFTGIKNKEGYLVEEMKDVQDALGIVCEKPVFVMPVNGFHHEKIEKNY